MSNRAPIFCPCCASESVERVGRLPDSHWFAGVRLNRKLEGGHLYRCEHCGLKFRSPVPGESVYDDLYDNAATATWSVDDGRVDWRLVEDYVRREKKGAAEILDYGCYTGGLMASLGARYRCHGVEVNRAAAGIAAQRITGHVWPSLDNIPEGQLFDIITAVDVLEHAYNPMSLIERLMSKLSSTGVMIITTGDADNRLWNWFGANWWYCFYPEHVSFISQRWLDYMSKQLPLSVALCETFRYRQSGRIARLVNGALVFLYGWFPRAYMLLGDAVRRTRGGGELTSVPGTGVSRDHLFVVLRRSTSQ